MKIRLGSSLFFTHAFLALFFIGDLCAQSSQPSAQVYDEVNLARADRLIAAIFGGSQTPKSIFHKEKSGWMNITGKVREVIRREGKIVLPKVMGELAGKDPVPGVLKETELHILGLDGNISVIKFVDGSVANWEFPAASREEELAGVSEEKVISLFEAAQAAVQEAENNKVKDTVAFGWGTRFEVRKNLVLSKVKANGFFSILRRIGFKRHQALLKSLEGKPFSQEHIISAIYTEVDAEKSLLQEVGALFSKVASIFKQVEATSKDVTQQVRDLVAKYGYIRIQRNMNALFGDPIPGKKKRVIITVVNPDSTLSTYTGYEGHGFVYIPDGTELVIKSKSAGKYLGEKEGRLALLDDNKDNPAAQLKVLAATKMPNTLGFQAITTGNNLQDAIGGNNNSRLQFINKNFGAKGNWENWDFVVDPDCVYLRNQASGRYAVVNVDGFVYSKDTTGKEVKSPGEAGGAGTFELEIKKATKTTVLAVQQQPQAEAAATPEAPAATTTAATSTQAAPAAEKPVREVVLPKGFTPEAGKLKTITLGSNANELEVWGIGLDNALYRFDRYSMAEVPWTKQDAKLIDGTILVLEDIACASDGTMVAVNNVGKSFKYNWDAKNWDVLAMGAGNDALDLDQIAVGNKDCIWATDNDSSTVYEYTKDKGWVARAEGIATFVAAGVDGTVAALNKNGTPFLFKDSKWHRMDEIALETIAVGMSTMIMGIDKNANLLEYKDSKFVAVKGEGDKSATGFDSIAMNAVGTVFLTDEDGDLYRKGDTAVAVTVKTSGDAAITTREIKPAVVQDGKETREDAVKKGKIKKKPAKKKTIGKTKKATKAKTKKTKATKKTSSKKKSTKAKKKSSAKKIAKKAVVKK